MADTEEPQFNTLAERIAALNKQKNFAVPNGGGAPSPAPAKKRPPPPPPPTKASTTPSVAVDNPVPPPRPMRNGSGAPPLPRRDTQNSANEVAPRATPPPLPSRTNSSQARPGMPLSRTSTQSSYLTPRRNSGSSEISQQSTLSNVSLGRVSSSTSIGSNGTAYKLPPTYDAAALPKLPPSKREREAKQAVEQAAKKEAAEAMKYDAVRSRAPLKSNPSTNSLRQIEATPTQKPPTPSRPTLPPRLPSRPAKSQAALNSQASDAEPQRPALPSRPVPSPQPTSEKPGPSQPFKITGFGSGKAPTVPKRVDPEEAEAPPPIPTASRPSAAQIHEAAQRTAVPKPNDFCWVCRDWSGPDNVAAQFPRQQLPRNDPVGHLAKGLCGPFPSYTDKARAIFTWFHHNIFYDTKAFFGNNVRHQTVEDTIFGGWAVCQGYADTYQAIAQRAGLDCVVVSGHGKGFGHTPLKKGEAAPPAKPDGHAWNAVRIDGGEWKLLDACWGAGHICGNNNLYKQEFSPDQFTRPNEKFGQSHFPKDPSQQFRSDGRAISWDEYFRGPIDGEPVQCFGNAKTEGIAEDSILPREKQISVYSGEVVRFQFSKVCEHWTPEKAGLGKPSLLLLSIHGKDGRKDAMIPIETDGYWHWVDVRALDLGAPGQEVQVATLTSIDGKDGRGVSASEFASKKGKCAMGWSYVMRWDLV